MWHKPCAAGGSSAITIQDGPHRTGHAAALTGPYRWKALESAANETQADIRPAARPAVLMLLNLLDHLLDKRVLSLSLSVGPQGGIRRSRCGRRVKHDSAFKSGEIRNTSNTTHCELSLIWFQRLFWKLQPSCVDGRQRSESERYPS